MHQRGQIPEEALKNIREAIELYLEPAEDDLALQSEAELLELVDITKVPSLNYEHVIRVLERDGWVIVRQRGSHIRLQKHTSHETLKLTVPAHCPILRSTLSHILKQARLSADESIETSVTNRRPSFHLRSLSDVADAASVIAASPRLHPLWLCQSSGSSPALSSLPCPPAGVKASLDGHNVGFESVTKASYFLLESECLPLEKS